MSESPKTETIETTAVAVPAHALTELTAGDIVERLDKIKAVQKRAMDKGIDYGTIPGTAKDGKERPTLLKAGAEKLCVLFRLDPQFQTVKREHPDGHVTIESTCVVYHQVSGQRLGSATAECSSREAKYAWRQGQRLCPKCGKPSILKSKFPNRQTGEIGWYCNKKAGGEGCGDFSINDPAIVSQAVGRIQNPDLPDTFPTVRRMAEKRALVAATRLVTGASAIFDEEMPEREKDEDDETPPEPEKHARVIAPDGDAPATKEDMDLLLSMAVEVLGEGHAGSWIRDQLNKRWGIKKGVTKKGEMKVRHIEELKETLGEKLAHMPEPEPPKTEGVDSDLYDAEGDVKF